jgi:hypothetical protein
MEEKQPAPQRRRHDPERCACAADPELTELVCTCDARDDGEVLTEVYS